MLRKTTSENLSCESQNSTTVNENKLDSKASFFLTEGSSQCPVVTKPGTMKPYVVLCHSRFPDGGCQFPQSCVY